METYQIYLLGFIGFVVATFIGSAISSAGANNMLDNFKSLGNLSGKTLDEIVKVVGQPMHISTMSDGGQLYQWMSNAGSAGGSQYHISLLFKDGLCQGVSSESMHNP